MAAHSQDAKHVLREVRLMRYLGVHDNIITLRGLSMRDCDDELYIVMELLDSDLHRIIQSSQSLSDAHHRYFMYQLLRGVNYLHKHNVIHRDLKPGNLLVTRNCELRITDFGLARLKPTREGEGGEEIEEAMTEHVVTRWYRPPELMLCPDGLYTAAVDMWSVGCIFAELLGRKPLFPGKNFVHQLTLIFDVIGSPRSSQVSHIKSRQAKKFLDSVRGKTAVDFETLYPACSPVAIDLLKKLLKFEPGERLDAASALNHSYFDALRKSNKSPDPPVSTDFEFDFESQNLSRGRLKALIAEEVRGMQRKPRGGASGAASSAAAEAAKKAALREARELKAMEQAKIEERERKRQEARVAALAKAVKSTGTTSSESPEAPTPKVRGGAGVGAGATVAAPKNKIGRNASESSSEEEENFLPRREITREKGAERDMGVGRGGGGGGVGERKSRLHQPTKSSGGKSNVRTTRSASSNRSTSASRVRSNSAGGSTERKGSLYESVHGKGLNGHNLYGGPVKATRDVLEKRDEIEEVTKAAASALRAAKGYEREKENNNVGGVGASRGSSRESSAGGKERKRRGTIPKSPKFSVLSWQKKMEGGSGAARRQMEARLRGAGY
ncbi:hypothetical protein TrVE_jg5357 [Triparma verrucosa]|nr:hypothetical protein TrVE_jg5357 [Triparma verrucosa]